MRVIIPFFKDKQLVLKQYLRQLNKKPLFTYIIKSVSSVKQIDSIEIWTDILEIADRITETDRIRCRFFEEQSILKGQLIQESETAIIINPNLPFISEKTLQTINQFDTEGIVLDKNNNQVWIAMVRECALFFSDQEESAHAMYIEVPPQELIDVSSKVGWWLAEKEINKRSIMIHLMSSSKLGTGHVYRGLTLASRLSMEHDVCFLFRDDQKFGIDMVQKEGYDVKVYHDNALEVITPSKPDIVINDLLNTSTKYMLSLKKLGCRVINFEDLGEGAEFADAVINALYPGDVPRENFYTGQKYYCIREDFLGVPKKKLTKGIEEILITYGGSDPQSLTIQTLLGLIQIQDKYNFHIRIILGPAYERHKELYSLVDELKLDQKVTIHEVVSAMAFYMRKADLVFTSAGRTMYEIATMATPAIVTAQNYRELTHTFGHPYNGFYHLGYCGEVSTEDYATVVEELIHNYKLRKLMHERMTKIDLSNGIDRVIKIILGEEQVNE